MSAKDNVVGTFLKDKRLRKGLSQGELGERLGYGSSQFISNLERGLAPLPPKIIREIIKLLDISEKEILSVMMKDYESFLVKSIRGRKK